MSIDSVSSASSTMMMPHRQMRRPDPTKMADDLFSKLDTKGQGYIEKSDLQSALDSISGTSSANGTSSSSNVDDLFSQLDGDSDGKVTKSEMESAMQKLSDTLDSQAMQSRMQMGGMGGPGGANGMPPPPPPGDDKGLTKDQLTQMSSEVSSTDSKRASFMSDVASNFDKADTDGDGKVSFKEAMAYEQSKRTESSDTSSTTSDGTSTSASDSTQSTQARLMMQLMQLMHAYAAPDSSTTGVSSLLSVSA